MFGLSASGIANPTNPYNGFSIFEIHKYNTRERFWKDTNS